MAATARLSCLASDQEHPNRRYRPPPSSFCQYGGIPPRNSPPKKQGGGTDSARTAAVPPLSHRPPHNNAPPERRSKRAPPPLPTSSNVPTTQRTREVKGGAKARRGNEFALAVVGEMKCDQFILEVCRHNDAMTTADDHHHEDEPKIAADGAVGGAYLLSHSGLPHITHVRSLPTLPSYNGVKSIELKLQAGSRERGFAAENASISAP